MIAPVFPYIGVRGIDAWGAGGYGAPRDNGSRAHPGTDFITQQCPQPSHAIATMSGTVKHTGFVYVDDPKTEIDETILGTIHLDCGEFYLKYYYAKPSVHVGDHVNAGDTIGEAQSLIPFYREKDETRDDITDHVHFEVLVRDAKGNLVRADPMRYVSEITPL